ncbi:50S ribosomal protein L6 [Candidatus Azambacteria bacterium]|nr:50S ribosomal protein L6 [Candidatus Azambacteria bacterium]
MASTAKNSVVLPEKVEALIVKTENGSLIVSKADEETHKALLGLTKALCANMVLGVINGFSKRLEIEGVGYRVALLGTKLVMQLGFSHPVEFEAPKGITFAVEKNAIVVSGIDKALVGQTAANIRKLKKAEPYKGKGIRYTGEVVRRKEGKRAGTV